MAQADVIRDRYPWVRRKPVEFATDPDPIETAPVPDAVHRTVNPDEVEQAAGQSSPGYNTSTALKRTGNARNDWMALVSGKPASLDSIAQAFPTFAEWYPGSSYEKADIKGPFGWADVIGNLDDPRGGAHWQWYQGSGTSRLPKSAYSPQFSDPLTREYERLLKSQTALYERQQADMDREAADKELVRKQTDDAVKKLMDFLNKRVDTLQQPAYTDSEAEVLKTRLLDPLERDRTASRNRTLNNIGSRGFDPSSGIAQQLFQDVDRVYDEQRTRTHGDIAYEQIQEERSRDQEAQDLLKYLAQLPTAAARGDLDFVNYLDNLVSQPGERALGTSALLADLPVQRAQLALQTLGLGGQPQSAVPGVLGLLDNARLNRQSNQQQGSDFWRNIGYSYF